MTKKYQVFLFLSFFFFCFIANGEEAYPSLERKIKLKQYVLAYQEALSLRTQYEGDPRFDYLYGLSALQTGHYNEAVFALDRVTVVSPNIIRPRLDLARAYLKLNNKTAAIKEFKDVLALSPPAIVRKNVSEYIAKLNFAGRDVSKSIIKRLASFSIGYDDNINFGTDNSEIELPDFGLVTLDPDAVKQKSSFIESKFQITKETTIDHTKSSFLLANFTHRNYLKNTNFDYSDLDFRAGMTINRRDKQYQFLLRDRPIFLDGKLYSNTLGIDAILKKNMKNSRILNSFLSIEKYDSKAVPLTDRNRVLLGVKLDQVKDDNQHQLSIYTGKEFAKKAVGKQFSRNIIGGGYKFSHKWDAKNLSFISLDYRNYKHQAVYPVFPSKKREDNRFVVKATHELQINKKITLDISASHINNESNLDLYNVKKNEVKIGIRYEWD